MKLPLSKIKELALLLGKKPIEDNPALPAIGVNFPVNRPDLTKMQDAGTIAENQVKPEDYGIYNKPQDKNLPTPPLEANTALYEKDKWKRALNTGVDRNSPEGYAVFKNQVGDGTIEDKQKKAQDEINAQQIQNAKDKKLIAKKRQANPIMK
jgi:hypothetical protein